MIITCRKEIPGRWILLTILPWASFTLNFQVIGQAFIFSLKKFVENPVGLTFILSLPSFIAIVVAPVASFLSDRIWTRFGRRKPFVVLASACMIVAFVVMPLAANVWLLVASYILYHFGEALCAPRDPLKQEIVPPAARGQATGAMTWCQNLAQVVFFAVILGRFDDVSYFAGIPLHGETVIYWSAALLLGVTPVVGVTEGEAAIDQLAELQANGFRPKTVGADKGYHNAGFIHGARQLGRVLHPALKQGQDSLRVRLTAPHAVSQLIRKRIEELIGWCKTTGNFRKSR